MGKHKTPHLNARNWRNLDDAADELDEPAFQKLRRGKPGADGDRKKAGAKPRDAFSRQRIDEQPD
ncbi:MAG: hypothetical protein V2J12_08280 [Gammaproteobacteria bacterium]|jgi:hypothetical protein|nr:hypothetical protein [Gammaproteobacteria bacterium]